MTLPEHIANAAGRVQRGAAEMSRRTETHETPRLRYWRRKLTDAQHAHQNELRKMGSSGASLTTLERHARAITRAECKIRLCVSGTGDAER